MVARGRGDGKNIILLVKTKRYSAQWMYILQTLEVPVTEMTREEKSEYTERVKADKDNIKKGYARIKETVKEIRQSFFQAVTTGKRSGSGKIVFEHYDFF